MSSPSPSPQPVTPESGPEGPTARLSTARLAVEGMHCEACVALIEETLLERPGVVSAAVDLRTARAVVGYDPALLAPDEVCASIADAGYTATPVD